MAKNIDELWQSKTAELATIENKIKDLYKQINSYKKRASRIREDIEFLEYKKFKQQLADRNMTINDVELPNCDTQQNTEPENNRWGEQF